MSGSPEDEPQRLARNINDLLQELRVALAGVQILFGFLLSIVFTDTYRRASDVQHGAHLVAVAFALIAMALMTAPAAWHRLLFRQRQRPEILRVSNGFAIAGLVSLALAMSATMLLAGRCGTRRSARNPGLCADHCRFRCAVVHPSASPARALATNCAPG